MELYTPKYNLQQSERIIWFRFHFCNNCSYCFPLMILLCYYNIYVMYSISLGFWYYFRKERCYSTFLKLLWWEITEANIFVQSYMLQSVDKKLWLVCHVWLIDLLAVRRSGCFRVRVRFVLFHYRHWFLFCHFLVAK